MQLVHHRPAAFLMEPQPLLRCQAELTRFGIVEIHLTQHLQHIATFIGEVLRHIHELPSTMRGIQSSGYRALSGARIYLDKRRLSRMLSGARESTLQIISNRYV